MYHSTLGSSVIKKKKNLDRLGEEPSRERQLEKMRLVLSFRVWGIGCGVQGPGLVVKAHRLFITQL